MNSTGESVHLLSIERAHRYVLHRRHRRNSPPPPMLARARYAAVSRSQRMLDDAPGPELSTRLDPTLPLVRIRPPRPYLVYLCGHWANFSVHWCPTLCRTQPCIRVGCTYCAQHLPSRPMTYIGVLHWRLHGGDLGWFRSVLEVPFRIGLRLKDMHRRCVSVCRQRACGRIDIEPARVRVVQPEHEPFSPLPPLLILWRVSRSTQFTPVDFEVE